jgi:hypothetical protein
VTSTSIAAIMITYQVIYNTVCAARARFEWMPTVRSNPKATFLDDGGTCCTRDMVVLEFEIHDYPAPRLDFIVIHINDNKTSGTIDMGELGSLVWGNDGTTLMTFDDALDDCALRANNHYTKPVKWAKW